MKSNAHILLVGRDEVLLQTRQLILGTFFQVETAGRVAHAAGVLARNRFELVVLCHSLSDDEWRNVVDLVTQQNPSPRILTLNLTGRPDAPVGDNLELDANTGPLALVKKCAEMLGAELKSVGSTRHNPSAASEILSAAPELPV
jgi:hypothetical protein